TAFCLAGAVAVFDGDRLTTSGRRLAWGGAALGFAGAIKVWAIIPVAPFAVLAPGRFYDSVVVAQLVRTGTRTPLAFRLQYLSGLAAWDPGFAVFLTAAIILAVAIAATAVVAWRVTRQGAPRLEGVGFGPALVILRAALV